MITDQGPLPEGEADINHEQQAIMSCPAGRRRIRAMFIRDCGDLGCGSWFNSTLVHCDFAPPFFCPFPHSTETSASTLNKGEPRFIPLGNMRPQWVIPPRQRDDREFDPVWVVSFRALYVVYSGRIWIFFGY